MSGNMKYNSGHSLSFGFTLCSFDGMWHYIYVAHRHGTARLPSRAKIKDRENEKGQECLRGLWIYRRSLTSSLQPSFNTSPFCSVLGLVENLPLANTGCLSQPGRLLNFSPRMEERGEGQVTSEEVSIVNGIDARRTRHNEFHARTRPSDYISHFARFVLPHCH